VIQLVPPRAAEFLPHENWGMAGTAHSEKRLQELLARVLVEGWRPAAGPDPDVFANCDRPAAGRIAEEILKVAVSRRQTEPHLVEPHLVEPDLAERDGCQHEMASNTPPY